MQFNKGLAVMQDQTGATRILSHCPCGYTVVRKFITCILRNSRAMVLDSNKIDARQ